MSFRSMIAGVSVAALAGSSLAVLGAVAPASAEVVPSCVSVGAFNTSGTCTVAAGETISVAIKGGNGGAGGAGGNGGSGGSGTNGVVLLQGGLGGLGGNGGRGGIGAMILGQWTNTTGATVEVRVLAGVDGAAGLAGSPGLAGADAPGPGAGSGGDGLKGGDGVAGSTGTDSAVSGLGFGVLAYGGSGGAGGTAGAGGTGGLPSGPGSNGADGTEGISGRDGQTAPVPLAAGFMAVTDTSSSAPGVYFSSVPIDVPVVDPVVPAYTG